MLVSTNNTPKNNKKENSTDEQRMIERLRSLLNNAIQLNDELEKKNSLLLYRIEQQQNQSQQSIQQDDYKQQLIKLQCQLSEVQSENQQLQSSLKNLKQLGNQNSQNNKKDFQLILQVCAISQIEKQFYEYFEKSSAVLQEQIILEFQNRLEKYQTKYQIVEIHKITSFTNLDKTKCIESQQREIDILELKLNNTEKELNELKLQQQQQQQSIKQNQQEQIQDFLNSNQFDIFNSNSQGIDECLSTDKKQIDIDNNQLKKDEHKLIQYEKIIENQKIQIENLQNKVSNLSKKKHQLKLQNQELSTVLYQQAETCQRIISNLQAKIEKQVLQIQYYTSIQQMRSKLNQQSSQHSVQNSNQQIDIKKKFTYHSPNGNNSPISIAKSYNNNRSLKNQDSSNDQTTWIIKTTDASLVKKLDKKDSQSESTNDQVPKATKLSTHLQEVKKSLDLISNVNCTQKLLKGYYFIQNKPILTLDDF